MKCKAYVGDRFCESDILKTKKIFHPSLKVITEHFLIVIVNFSKFIINRKGEAWWWGGEEKRGRGAEGRRM